MKKRIYSAPRTEATMMPVFGTIMVTSIGMNGSNLPVEPGKNLVPKNHAPMYTE